MSPRFALPGVPDAAFGVSSTGERGEGKKNTNFKNN